MTDRPSKTALYITTAASILCDGDAHRATASTSAAGAFMLGKLSRGHPDDNFERGLATSLEMYEKVARSARNPDND